MGGADGPRHPRDLRLRRGSRRGRGRIRRHPDRHDHRDRGRPDRDRAASGPPRAGPGRRHRAEGAPQPADGSPTRTDPARDERNRAPEPVYARRPATSRDRRRSGETRMSPSSPRVTRATATFDPVPSRIRSALLTIDVAAAPPPGTEALGVPVATSGDVPPIIGVDRARLLESGFSGALGQTLVLPHEDRPRGRGGRDRRPGQLDAAGLRDAAAAFARAAARDGVLATTLTDVAGVERGRGRTGRRRRRAPGPLSLPRVRRPARRGAADLADPGGHRWPRSLRSGPAPSGAACWPRRSRSRATWRTRRRRISPRSGWPRSPRPSGPRPASRSRSSTTTPSSSSAAAGCWA